ncbi:DsbA family oxidoreductase [Sphingomonas sp. SRS2]|uniref:DsbA family oxidoreductase n=1 Tax=Sphingomonas sp. SRS2 TaxID=133190 RepID=UPI0006184EF8|nr:DsbA family oxidoreductase [Sphingomonas sp. SRS2]KKC25191.1 DSBA oxidoreductase [Sphingomonas sp. SRS2]
MTPSLKIDFISDVSCPWCLIGAIGLERALARSKDVVTADIRFQPFELNPTMPAGGENVIEHLARKHGATAQQSAPMRAMVQSRAAELGFTIATSEDSRIYNTFDAHRLLYWAALIGCDQQRALKHALFEAYFTRALDPSNHDILMDAAEASGLDRHEAGALLASERYADDVRALERQWRQRGITTIPAVIVNDRFLISGGQLPEAYEAALRNIAADL